MRPRARYHIRTAATRHTHLDVPAAVVELHVVVPRQPAVVVGMRERLLELGAVELGKGAGHAAEVFARLEYEDDVLAVLQRHADLVHAERPAQHLPQSVPFLQ